MTIRHYMADAFMNYIYKPGISLSVLIRTARSASRSVACHFLLPHWMNARRKVPIWDFGAVRTDASKKDVFSDAAECLNRSSHRRPERTHEQHMWPGRRAQRRMTAVRLDEAGGQDIEANGMLAEESALSSRNVRIPRSAPMLKQ
jgi:hypothetical protein